MLIFYLLKHAFNQYCFLSYDFFLDSARVYHSLIIDICIVNLGIDCFVVWGFFLCAGTYLTGWLQFHSRKKWWWSVIPWYSTKNRLIAKEIITSFCSSSFLWSLLSESWFQVAREICPDYRWRYSTCRHFWDRTQKSDMEEKSSMVMFPCFK